MAIERRSVLCWYQRSPADLCKRCDSLIRKDRLASRIHIPDYQEYRRYIGNILPITDHARFGGVNRADESMKGSCLCGEVGYEFEQAIGSCELCHCNRCRKVSGSAYLAILEVNTVGHHVVRGKELMRCYGAPIIERPPAYTVWFCSHCGSLVPDPELEGDVL
jgi:hypothetical protein